MIQLAASRCLLLENDLPLGASLVRLLSPMYREVIWARTVAEGCAFVTNAGYAALLCEWELDDGVAAKAVLLSGDLHPDARRVVMSRYDPHELRACMPPGSVDHYLRKPCGSTLLLAAMAGVTPRPWSNPERRDDPELG